MNVKKKPNSLRNRIGSLLPAPIKKSLIWLNHRPAKIHAWFFQAASKGKIPCPDKLFLKWMFKVFTGQKLNLKNPLTYQDKLNWLKLYYRVPLHTKLVDKYAVREWVAEKIGEEYLVPLYGVYEQFEDIDFDKLPNQFVLKCTHDSGSVVICRDKQSFDMESAEKKIKKGLALKQFYLTREWPYKNVKPRVICEQYLYDNFIEDAPDYKFFCFNGKPKLIMVNSERRSTSGVKTNVYDLDWNLLSMREQDYPNNPKTDIKPQRIQEMIHLAEVLAKGLPHIRVDFNYVNNKIFFGEMTFFHTGGRTFFQPFEYNLLLGSWITLPEKTP